jgi:hypothetical protein
MSFMQDRNDQDRRPQAGSYLIGILSYIPSDFFDAGEFTDLNNITISDMFKRFLKGSRYKR